MERLYLHLALDDPELPEPESPPPPKLSYPKGVEAMDARVSLAEATIGYVFTDKALILEALIMDQQRTVTYLGQLYTVGANKHLAWLGDRLLDTVLGDQFYKIARNTGVNADATRMDYVTNKALAIRAYGYGLDKCGIRFSRGVSSISDWRLATISEALVGAAFLDAGGGGSGFEQAKKAMVNLGFYDDERNALVKKIRASEMEKEKEEREEKMKRKAIRKQEKRMAQEEAWYRMERERRSPRSRSRSRSPDDHEDLHSDLERDRERYRKRDKNGYDNEQTRESKMDEFGEANKISKVEDL